MSHLIRSISGVRGIVGETITPEVVQIYMQAFLELTGARKIIVGRDSRPSGTRYEEVVIATCEKAGVEVIPLGLAATPTIAMMVTRESADGGIIISASHNSIEWNALKFLNDEGISLGHDELERFLGIVDDYDSSEVSNSKAQVFTSSSEEANTYHIQEILALPYIDTDLIQSKGYRVAYDAVNGAGSEIIPELLERLGCEIHTIHTTPDGTFPRGPEPITNHLQDLEQLAQARHCDVGFATDPDADRLGIVDNTGHAISEEYVIPISADLVYTHISGPMTVNLSSSRLNDDIAKKYGQEIIRAKVGERNVVETMIENGSIIGGEGNGGVILSELHYGRDAVVGVALILQWMAENNRTIEDFVKSTPSYEVVRGKIDRPDGSIEKIYQKIEQHFKRQEIDTRDGIWIDHGDAWVQIRASNTEPILRLIAEARTTEQAHGLCQEIQDLLGGVKMTKY